MTWVAVGTAAAVGAGVGAGSQIIQGKDPDDILRGALLGGATGALTGGAGAALGGGAGGTSGALTTETAAQIAPELTQTAATNIAPAVATQAAPAGITQVAPTFTQAELNAISQGQLDALAAQGTGTQVAGPAMNITAVPPSPTSMTPSDLAQMTFAETGQYPAQAPLTLPPGAAPEAPITSSGLVAEPPTNPFVEGFRDVVNWAEKNPFKAAAIGYTGLNLMGGFRSAQQPSTFGGPSTGSSMSLASDFRPGPYSQPNVYRPRYAMGGITSASYPQSGIDQTQYATPTQMPTSAEVVASDYDAPTSPFTGELRRMNSGGITALAKGSNSEMFKKYKSMMEGERPTATASRPEVKLMEDTDPDTKYQDALTATLIRQGKINKRANMPTPTLARPTQMGVVNLSAPGTQSAASGGIMGYNLGGYASGGNPRLLKGPGDGMSDDIPATIGNRQPARLADGEFVIPADVVSGLGNGSTEAGARKLHKMMDKVRVARTGKKKQAPAIKADKYLA